MEGATGVLRDPEALICACDSVPILTSHLMRLESEVKEIVSRGRSISQSLCFECLASSQTHKTSLSLSDCPSPRLFVQSGTSLCVVRHRKETNFVRCLNGDLKLEQALNVLETHTASHTTASA